MTELHHFIEITAPTTKVYEALVTQEGMRSWWTADSHLEEKVGGKAEFGFMNRAVLFRMTIDALEPGKRVQMSCSGDHPEWKGTVLEWRLADEGGTTHLSFIHRNWREMTQFCASCNSTWGELMYRLKANLEGNNMGPRWTS